LVEGEASPGKKGKKRTFSPVPGKKDVRKGRKRNRAGCLPSIRKGTLAEERNPKLRMEGN